jgi:hypothetical protein
MLCVRRPCWGRQYNGGLTGALRRLLRRARCTVRYPSAQIEDVDPTLLRLNPTPKTATSSTLNAAAGATTGAVVGAVVGAAARAVAGAAAAASDPPINGHTDSSSGIQEADGSSVSGLIEKQGSPQCLAPGAHCLLRRFTKRGDERLVHVEVRTP